MAESERAAWRYVKRLALGAQLTQSAQDRYTALEQIAVECDRMLAQLRNDVHLNPALLVGLNPGRRMRRNPLPGTAIRADEQISDRVYQVKYRHLDDGQDYQHPFAAGVELWTVTMGKARGVVLVGRDGQDLWDDF